MATSGKTSKYGVLCVAIALGCSLFGILLGVSLNLNSHDVLSSYRSSTTTLAHNNAQLANIVDAECYETCQQTASDTITLRKVKNLMTLRSKMHQYLDSLRTAFILYVDVEPSEQLRRLDAVAESTNFMMDQGNARKLRAGGNIMLLVTLGGLVPLTAFLTAWYLNKEEENEE